MISPRLILLLAVLCGGAIAVSRAPTAAEYNDQAKDLDVVRADDGDDGITVGQCFVAMPPSPAADVAPVSCDRTHRYEVYYRYQFPAGDFLGETTVRSQAEQQCLAAFEPFVGLNYVDSIYAYDALAPSQEEWDRADGRAAVCLLSRFDGSERVGTARGTAS